jgi:hypothetical protein
VRDEREERLKANSETVVPLGPSVYSGPVGHLAEGQPAARVSAAIYAGPCLHAVAENDGLEPEPTGVEDPGTNET